MNREMMKRRIPVIFLIDTASYLLLYLFFQLSFSLFMARVEAIPLPDSVLDISEAEAAMLTASLQHDYYFFIGNIIIFLLVASILWLVSRAIVWRLTYDNDITLSYLLRSIMLLPWFFLGFLLMFFINALKEGIMAIALTIFILVYSYFSMLLFLDFARTEKVALSTFKDGATKIRLISTVFIIAVIYLFVSQTLNMMTTWLGTIGIILSLLITACYAAFARFYIAEKRG